MNEKQMEQISLLQGVNSKRVQLEMTVEEASELIQAIQKLKRYDDELTDEHVCEEIADVLIMVNQLRITMGVERVDSYINSKLKRQLYRLEIA